MRNPKAGLLVSLLAIALLLGGCGGRPAPGQPVSLTDVYRQMEEQVGLPLMLEMTPELALDFYGIDTARCAQWVLRLAQDSLTADEVLLIEARDAAAAEEIHGYLQGRMEAKAAEAITYSPEQYAIIRRGHLLRDGLYLALIVSPDAEALLKVYRGQVPG